VQYWGFERLPFSKLNIIYGDNSCGKTTLCEQFIEECITDKKMFRYIPSRLLSSISENSQVSIKQDLLTIYHHYYGIEALDDQCKNSIKDVLKKARFDDADAFDFDKFLNNKIYSLSGGQQQRYWFVRVLFDYQQQAKEHKNAELLILDESIASLDCITKNEIIAMLLQNVFAEQGMTILFVSHDLRDIDVIYKTLGASGVKTETIFEHYEMFDKNIYRVLTPFSAYRENLLEQQANRYQAVTGGKELCLKLGNSFGTGKRIKSLKQKKKRKKK
jgi:ABC-type Mn2+/Zn2+ transport system ATPase subunit